MMATKAETVMKYSIFDGAKSITLDQYPDSAWTWYSGKPNDVSIELREWVPWVTRAERLFSNAISQLPFCIYQGENEIDTSEDYQNVVEFLPNPPLFLRLLGSALFVYGRSYYLKNTNRAQFLKELKYFVPSSIEPDIDPVEGLTKFVRSYGTTQIEYKPKQILYFWPQDAAVELGPPTIWPLKSMLHAMGVLGALDEFTELFFKRGAIKATLLGVSGNPPQAERDKLESWWGKFMSGLKGAWQAKVINAERVTATVIGEGLDQLTDTNLTREKKEDIAAAADIPFSVLFSDAANYATASSDWQGWYNTSIIPWGDWIASTLNEQLFTAMGYRFVFRPQEMDIFQEDETQRAGSLGQLVTAGVPLTMSMELLGYDLTDEQWAELKAAEEEKKRRADEMAAQLGKPKEEEEPPTEKPFEQEKPKIDEDEEEDEYKAAKIELARWKRKTLRLGMKRLEEAAQFESDIIPAEQREAIAAAILGAKSADDLRAAFACEPEPDHPLDMAALLAEMKRANDLLERSIKYSDDQPRDDAGRWSGGGGGGSTGGSRMSPERRAELERMASQGNEKDGNNFDQSKPITIERDSALPIENEIGLKKAGETVIVYDRDGNIYGRQDSSVEHDQKSSVNVSSVNVPAGAIVSHNHPSGDSFSIRDLDFARSHNLGEIRAVTSTKIYSMRSNKWPSIDRITQAVNNWDWNGSNNNKFWSSNSESLGIDYQEYDIR